MEAWVNCTLQQCSQAADKQLYVFVDLLWLITGTRCYRDVRDLRNVTRQDVDWLFHACVCGNSNKHRGSWQAMQSRLLGALVDSLSLPSAHMVKSIQPVHLLSFGE